VLGSDTSHLDYFMLVKAARRLDTSSLSRKVRVAVLSDASTQHLVPVLKVLFARAGFAADVHEAEFDTMETEILDEGSALYQFSPDAVVMLPATNALRRKYHESKGDRSRFGEEVAERAAMLWDTLKKRSKAIVVQGNYVVPYERELGSYSLKVSESLASNVIAANAKLAELARSRGHVLLADIEGVASYVGKKTFVDEKLWTMAKSFAALEHLPLVAQSVVDVVTASKGAQCKCVVLDLDNTLWGGIVGDDGLDGIQIGPYGEGEPFHRFQQYLRELKRRGIILAVCSKNEHDTAMRAFREHPEMVLREEDIAVFVANWETKVDNIKRIKETLNIGFDAIAFVDDNPFERNIVRQYLPDVIVPEMPEEPSDYVRALSELNLFETTSFTEEDRQRADLYREEAQRKVLEKSFTNVGEYLQSLEMKVTWKRFDSFHLPRIAQLIQRSNQFNLTTRRQSQADCEALMNAGDDVLPFYVKLADKFGDYGLISVVVGKVMPDHLYLDTWLMSCRVLTRGVEEYAMNQMVAAAKARGLPLVVGEYLPTSKNMMVKDFYARFGFHKTKEDDKGTATWVLEVASYEPRATYLSEVSA
jgi:FkbH-like protein